MPYIKKLHGTDPDLEILRSVFSRGGFTDGYLKGQRTLEMFGVRSKEDVTAARGVLGRLAAENKNVLQRVPLRMNLSLHEEIPVELTVADELGNRVTAIGPVPEKGDQSANRSSAGESFT